MRKFRVVNDQDTGVLVASDSFDSIAAGMGLTKLQAEGHRWRHYRLDQPMTFTFASSHSLHFNVSVIIEDMGPIHVFQPSLPVEAAHEKDPCMSHSGDDL